MKLSIERLQQKKLQQIESFVLKTIFTISTLLFLSTSSNSQPYIDLVNIRYTGSPLLSPSSAKTILNNANVSLQLPVKLKNADVLIISPFLEKWTTEVKNEESRQSYYGISLPVTYLKNLKTGNSLIAMAVIRMNDERIDRDGKLQVGGAALFVKKRSESLSWKFGVYANGDLFGLFVVPLAGIDWKINEKSNLFGVLPANLTYERKLNGRIYCGANFRTFTNSYAKDTGYWRVDENQIGAFADFYFTKHLLLNLEAGSSVLRKLRTRTEGKPINQWNVTDNLYIKFSVAYRMRFR
jgi:hypothetical protein